MGGRKTTEEGNKNWGRMMKKKRMLGKKRNYAPVRF